MMSRNDGQATRKKILDQLHISALRELVRRFDFPGVDKRSRRAMTEALTLARGVSVAELQTVLERTGAAGEIRSATGATGPVFVAIDFETADRGRDSACAVGLVRVEGEQISAREHYLIRPPRPTFEFTHIHGITRSMVHGSPTFGELWPKLGGWLSGVDFLVAHNASFDRSVLGACCRNHGLRMPSVSFECTVKLARRQWGIYPTKLPDVCRRLDIELDHHQALSDAEAAAQIMIQALREGYRPC